MVLIQQEVVLLRVTLWDQPRLLGELPNVKVLGDFLIAWLLCFFFCCSLLEERNMNRIRMEAAKASSAAVLRQQVFHFDPNYDPLTGGSSNPASMQQQMLSIGGSGALGGGGGSMSQQDYGSVGGGGSSVGPGPYPPNGTSSSSLHTTYSQRGPSFNARGSQGATVEQQSNGQMHGIATHATNTSNHTQEELLKQLFPSWF